MRAKRFVLFSVFYGGSAALLKLIGFSIFLWMAKILPVEEYALFGLLYALQQGIATFALAGIVEAVVGLLKDNRQPDLKDKLFASANMSFLLMAFSAIVFAALLLATYFKNSSVDILTYCCVLGSGVLLAFAALQAQIVRLEEKHHWSLAYSFFPPLIGLAGGLAAFVQARTVPAFFVGSIVGLTILLLSLRFCHFGLWKFVTRGGVAWTILRRAAPFMLIAFFGWLSGYGNNYLIDHFFTRTDVARFTFALSLCSIMLLIAGALNQVWSPLFYRLIQQLPFEAVERKNQQFYKWLSFVLGFFGGAVVLVFPTAVGLVGGNLSYYMGMNLEIALLFAAYVFLTPWWQCNNHFLWHAKGQSILKITLVTSFIGISLLLILMRVFGQIGVYMGFLIQMLLRSAGIVLVAKKYWIINVAWSGVAAGLALVFSGWLLSSSETLTSLMATIVYLFIALLLAKLFFSGETFVIDSMGDAKISQDF